MFLRPELLFHVLGTTLTVTGAHIVVFEGVYSTDGQRITFRCGLVTETEELARDYVMKCTLMPVETADDRLRRSFAATQIMTFACFSRLFFFSGDSA